MKNKSWFQMRLGLMVFSLCVLCSVSITWAQTRPRRLGSLAVPSGCDPIVGCWGPLLNTWPASPSTPLEAIHMAVVPTPFGTDTTNAIAKVLMYDFGTYNSSTTTTTISAKLWDPYCTALTPNDPSCFTSVPLPINLAGQPGATIFCGGHNFLSDGKMLTIGGDYLNNIALGEGKGPVIAYTFDPLVTPAPPLYGWAQKASLKHPADCVPGPRPNDLTFDCNKSPLVGPGTPPAWDCHITCYNGGRFYPTGIAMDVQIDMQTYNGQILAFSGLDITSTERTTTNPPCPCQELNQTFERYDPLSNSWNFRYLDSAKPPAIDPNFDLYPRMHLFPSSLPGGAGPKGSVFYVAYGAATNGYQGQLYDPTANALTAKAAPSVYRKEGTSVLLPLTLGTDGTINNEVRVLALGGCDVTNSPPAPGGGDPCLLSGALNLNSAEVYRTGTSGTPLNQWDAAGTMAEKRQHPNTLLLPDGNVFVSGGEKTSGCDPRGERSSRKICPGDPSGACIASLTANLFNPANNTWTTLPSMARFRQYHSGAVLLEDGSVLVAGGDTDQCCCAGGNTCTATSLPTTACSTAQIYYPGYLARTGTAPGIGMFSTPPPPQPPGNVMSYGANFTIPMATDGTQVNKVVLIRPSAVTHSFNNEQRSIQVPIVSQSTTSVVIKAPANVSIAPRGYYMLYVVTGTGTSQIPSDAAWVQLP